MVLRLVHNERVALCRKLNSKAVGSGGVCCEHGVKSSVSIESENLLQS